MNILIHTAFLIGVYATAALGRPRVNNQLRTILGQYKRSRGYSGERGGGGGRRRRDGRGVYGGSGDTLLDDYFCQNYYDGGNMEDCHQLRAKVKYNHTRAVPTLELGDPSKPAMFFLHGWPDSSALWANQFDYFCGSSTSKYFCVAPSWFDYHPDVPAKPRSDLLWDKQIEAFHHALAVEMGLKNLTVVMFDFGAVVGYQFVYRYPHLVKRVVAMDIGMELLGGGKGGLPPGTPTLEEQPAYVQTNIRSFLSQNNTMMRTSPAVIGTPCANCDAIINANIGWPYWQMVRDGPKETWPERVVPHVPRAQWNFSFAPGFPEEIPLLFTYGTCDDNTGCHGCPPCADRSGYIKYFKPWIRWVDQRNVDSRSVAISGGDHWSMCRKSKQVNAEIHAWLEGETNN